MRKLSSLDEESKKISILKQTSVRETYPLHTHDFYEFFLVTKGRAIHVVNGISHVVERGSLVFVRPTDYHCYDYYKTADFEFYNKGFEPDLFESINHIFGGACSDLVNRPLPKHIKLDVKDMHNMEQQILFIIDSETEQERELPTSMLITYVTYRMLTTHDFDQAKMPPDWLINALDEMSKPENFIVGLPRLLEICNYTQAHINREFKRYLSTTPTKLINELRLRHAHDLLSETEGEIIDICQISGFNNLSHFYTEFKNYYGYSPNKVRTME